MELFAAHMNSTLVTQLPLDLIYAGHFTNKTKTKQT